MKYPFLFAAMIREMGILMVVLVTVLVPALRTSLGMTNKHFLTVISWIIITNLPSGQNDVDHFARWVGSIFFSMFPGLSLLINLVPQRASLSVRTSRTRLCKMFVCVSA